MLCSCREILAQGNDLHTYIETCNKLETTATVQVHIQFCYTLHLSISVSSSLTSLALIYYLLNY